MAYSKATLKSSGVKHLALNHFGYENYQTDFTYTDFTYFNHVLMSLTNVMGILNSIRM
jgi:hypothetical protein